MVGWKVVYAGFPATATLMFVHVREHSMDKQLRPIRETAIQHIPQCPTKTAIRLLTPLRLALQEKGTRSSHVQKPALSLDIQQRVINNKKNAITINPPFGGFIVLC